MYGKWFKTNCVWFAALILAAALSGCTQVAQVAAPEVQAVNSNHLAVVETDRIYDNISINGIPVGGLTREQAVKKVTEELLAPIKSQKVILKCDGKTWPLELESLGYEFGVEEAVEEAYGVARTGTTEERYEEIMALGREPYEIEIEPTYKKLIIDVLLADIAYELDTPPVEPVITRENKEFVTTPGADGSRVDIDTAKAEITELADAMEGGEVTLVTQSVPPKFTVESLMEANALIGSFSTPVTGSASRDVNLKVASDYINGVVLYPDEVFSTNETIGPTTYERGYRVAPVIENGRLVDGMGGGVCQVSSTLYNAVLFSELEIVQRQNHSLVVGYVAIGRDATLAGDVIDFKFKNNTEYPILIESYLEDKRLYVNIYGYETRPENRTLDFESVWVSSTAAPPENEIPDPTLPLGERVVDVTSLGGSVVDVYKKVFIDGVETEKIYVDRSSYKSRAGEVRVGTGEAVPLPEAPEAVPETVPAPVADGFAPTIPETPVESEQYPDNSTVPEWLDTNPLPDEPWTPVDFR